MIGNKIFYGIFRIIFQGQYGESTSILKSPFLFLAVMIAQSAFGISSEEFA